MRRQIFLAVLSSAVALPALGNLERALLAIQATPANVVMAVSTGGRRAVNLPNLEFPVRIEPVCPAPSALTSVSITIADARYRYTPDDFGGKDSLETTIVVPAPQIAPVTIEHNCAEDAPADASGVFVPDVLTAQASLRCASEEGEQLLFEVIGLGVEVRCPQPEAAAAVETSP